MVIDGELFIRYEFIANVNINNMFWGMFLGNYLNNLKPLFVPHQRQESFAVRSLFAQDYEAIADAFLWPSMSKANPRTPILPKSSVAWLGLQPAPACIA